MLYFWQNDTFSICSTRVVMVFQQSCFCTKFQENITHIIVWDSTSLCPVLRLWYMTIMILLWFLLSLILWQFFFVRSYPVRFSSVQSLSRVWLFAWTAAHQASLSITNSQSLPKFLSIKWWCHPVISSFVISFSSHLQSFQSSGSFPMSQFFTSGGLNIGVSASASVLLIEYSGLIFLGWTGWISLQSKGLSSLLKHHSSKHRFFVIQPSLWSDSHIHTWLLEKLQLLLCRSLSAKWCLWLLMCCQYLLSYPSKEQVSFNSMTAVTIYIDFGAQKNKVCHCFPISLPWSYGTGCHDPSFLNVEF